MYFQKIRSEYRPLYIYALIYSGFYEINIYEFIYSNNNLN